MRILATVSLGVLLGFMSPITAEERPDHFEAQPSPTLNVALENLAEFNPKLGDLIEQESLSAEDLNTIHQLTYTLEQALGRLGEEKDRVAALLEEVHLASERSDSKTVKSSGRSYLEGTAPLIE